MYFVLNNRKDNLEKFGAKSEKAIFLEYSSTLKEYRVFNKRNLQVKEFILVIFDESSSKCTDNRNEKKVVKPIKNF